MKKKIPYGSKVPFKLTLAERDLIRDHTFYDPNFARVVEVVGKSIRLEMSLDEIEDLQGYVAAEANHSEDRRIQAKLDRLFEKLGKFLDQYDDQWEGQETDTEEILPSTIEPNMTAPARRFWNSISPDVREKIINNVFCGKCPQVVRMNLDGGNIVKGDLVLRGTCGRCGGEVARLVEGPDS